MYMCVPNNILKVKVLQSSPSFVNPIDYSLSGSSVHEILQALEWVAVSLSRGSSKPMDWTQVSSTAGGFFTIWATKAFELIVIYLYQLDIVS